LHSVYPGSAARDQLSHGEIVRVAQGTVTAEASAAPDVVVASDVKLPWVGAVLVTGRLAGLLAALSFSRRVFAVR
jgi:hypothetical protein